MNDGRRTWLGTLARAPLVALWALREIARTGWGLIRAPIIGVLQVLAALIVLFEEWGWRPLAAALGYLAKLKPFALLEAWIARLPPYGALVVFALPTTILLPLKFVAMWLLAGGHVLAASGLFVAAKIASTALVARIFMLTKPALMRLAWFARAYNWFMPWKEALFAQIRRSFAWRYGRMVKSRVKQELRKLKERYGPAVRTMLQPLRDSVRGLALRIRTVLFGPPPAA